MTGRLIVTPFNTEKLLHEPLLVRQPVLTGYNIPPKQFVSIICNDQTTGVPCVSEAYWGYSPHWLKVLDNAPYLARSETLNDKTMFQDALTRRCLIPVSGYYEWKRYTRHKKAFAIRRPENRSFLLAGVCIRYPTSEHTWYETFAILTVASNSFINLVSERMPVVIHRQDADSWLNSDIPEAEKLIQTADEDYLEYYPVSELVNNPANQSRAVSEPTSKRFRYTS